MRGRTGYGIDGKSPTHRYGCGHGRTIKGRVCQEIGFSSKSGETSSESDISDEVFETELQSKQVQPLKSLKQTLKSFDTSSGLQIHSETNESLQSSPKWVTSCNTFPNRFNIFGSHLDSNSEEPFGNRFEGNQQQMGPNISRIISSSIDINRLSERGHSTQWQNPLPITEPFGSFGGQRTPFAPQMPLPSANHWMTSIWKNTKRSSELIDNNSEVIEDLMDFESENHFKEPIFGSCGPSKRTENTGTTSTDYSIPKTTQFNQTVNLWPNRRNIRRREYSKKGCSFCISNNEIPEVYKTHYLKDSESNIICPILRAYDCPLCHNGGGDRAHTRKHCPLFKTEEKRLKLEVLSKSEIINSFLDDCIHEFPNRSDTDISDHEI